MSSGWSCFLCFISVSCSDGERPELRPPSILQKYAGPELRRRRPRRLLAHFAWAAAGSAPVPCAERAAADHAAVEIHSQIGDQLVHRLVAIVRPFLATMSWKMAFSSLVQPLRASTQRGTA